MSKSRLPAILIVLFVSTVLFSAVSAAGTGSSRAVDEPTPDPIEPDERAVPDWVISELGTSDVASNSAFHSANQEPDSPMLEEFANTPVVYMRAPMQINGVHLDGWSNDEALTCFLSLGGVWGAATGAGYVTSPPLDFFPQLAVYASQTGAKHCAPFVAAPDRLVYTPENNGCDKTLYQPIRSNDYDVIYGLPTDGLISSAGLDPAAQEVLRGVSDLQKGLSKIGLAPGFLDELNPNWGDIGRPTIAHFNSAVRVSMESPRTQVSGDYVTFKGPGAHTVAWEGQPLISPLDYVFIYVPGKPAKGKQDKYARERVFATFVSLGLMKANTFIDPQPHPEEWGIHNIQGQTVYVLDSTPPQASTSTPVVVVEAVDPGGVSASRHLGSLQRMITATDNCDNLLDIRPIGSPEFWPVDTTINFDWRISDDGPRTADGREVNSAFVPQTIRVVDTLPPVVVAPPSIVTETVSSLTELHIGVPAVFDFADLSPTISHNALNQSGVQAGSDATSYLFPQGKTTITWEIEDASGNKTVVTQLVNVKQVGTNNSPTANNDSIGAVANEPITITLTAQDQDADPLWFSITSQPKNGFFIPPLFPYFIEDYRLPHNTSRNELLQICADNDNKSITELPSTNEINSANFIGVDKEGNFIVHDTYFRCSGTSTNRLDTNWRFAKFSPEGELLVSINAGNPTNIGLNLDAERGYLYVSQHSNCGVAHVNRYRLTDLERDWQLWRNDQLADGQILCYPKNSILDSNGILYLIDRTKLYAWDARPRLLDENADLIYLGEILNIPGNPQPLRDIALDHEENLLVSDHLNDRIHKISASKIGENGEALIGEAIGWMGGCEEGPGCDSANNRSVGYSCSDACVQPAGGWQGSGPGQFHDPLGIATDSRGNLYVIDGGNRRVQRFSPEGIFAGIAENGCDTSCFILSEFGYPTDITVSDEHFHMFDEAEDILYIYETTPLTPIDPVNGKQAATVVYQSDNNFICPTSDSCDSFQFAATDGLATSNTATIGVHLSRNFRQPDAFDQAIETDEDVPVSITLTGYDLDESLDTMTFEIVNQPVHGSLSQTQPTVTYTPDEHYNGSDTFTFVAKDGLYASEPATVTLTIHAVNDAPIITLPEGLEFGLGFQKPITVTVFDPDVLPPGAAGGDVNYFLWIDWEPGDRELRGDIEANSDGESEMTGPIMINTGSASRILGAHTYETAGTRELSIRVDDAGIGKGGNANVIESIEVSVIPMVDVSLTFLDEQDPLVAMPGRTAKLTMIVRNNKPDAESVTGLTATNVQLENLIPDEMIYQSAVTTKGSCGHHSGTLACNLGSMVPGEVQTVTLTVKLGSQVVPGMILENEAIVTQTQPDANPNNSQIEATTLVKAGDFIVNDPGFDLDTDPFDGICRTVNETCTLKAAVQSANNQTGAQTIVLGPGVFAAGRNGEDDVPQPEEYLITDDLTILGFSQERTILHGVMGARVLHIKEGANVVIKDLTITGGGYPEDEEVGSIVNGGGLLNSNGTVRLENVIVSNNQGLNGAGLYNFKGTMTLINTQVLNNVTDPAGDGGGILNRATLIVENSSIAGNMADQDGGGIHNGTEAEIIITDSTVYNNVANFGGGIVSEGGLDIENSTVAENRAFVDGGGLQVSTSASGHASLLNVTIGRNRADSNEDGTGKGGGIVVTGANPETVTMRNTLIGDNSAVSAPDCSGAVTSQGHNLVANSSGCTFSAKVGDQLDLDAQLKQLVEINGTRILPLEAGSPAVNTANGAFCPALDQRGLERPQGSGCDIGAFEFDKLLIFLPMIAR